MFSTAKKVVKEKPTKTAAKKDFVELEGLADFAAATTVLKNIESWKKTLESPLKEKVLETFLSRANGARPTNFRGIEDGTEASVELRKRSTRSPLTESEQEVLTEAGVPFGIETDVTDTFIVNPDHLGWLQENEEAVTKALSKVRGLPTDLFLKQVATVKAVVTDDSVEQAFKTDERDAIEVVTTLAIKPVFAGGVKAAFEAARVALFPTEAEKKAKLKKELKGSLKAV